MWDTRYDEELTTPKVNKGVYYFRLKPEPYTTTELSWTYRAVDDDYED